MKKRIASGYGLSLFEIVIAIGFFAVFAAVFVRLFLSARTMQARSADVSSAVAAAQNAAESFKAGTAPALYYDEQWRPAQQAGAAFVLTCADSTTGGVVTERIAVKTAAGEALYSLTVKKAGAVD